MNLFRSEEHVRNWKSFITRTDEGILSMPDLLKLFAGPFFRCRMDEDYFSHMREYARGMIEAMKEIGKTGPFWKKPKK
ncbi:MAG TPA: hypothetical protein VMT12_02900 [Syntrophales bacterium]|nr:hypothetical protein [Syntrophales bacterium]